MFYLIKLEFIFYFTLMWDGYKDETSFYKFHSALKLTHHRLYLFIIIKKLKQGNFYEENSSRVKQDVYVYTYIPAGEWRIIGLVKLLIRSCTNNINGSYVGIK